MKIQSELNKLVSKELKLTPGSIKVGSGRKQLILTPKRVTKKPATKVNRPKPGNI